MKYRKKIRNSALTKQEAQIAFGMHAVAIAAIGRMSAIAANVMLSPFVLVNAVLEGVIKGLDKTEDAVLNGALLEKVERELEDILSQENPEAFKQLEKEISDAFEIQAKRFEKALSNIEVNPDRSDDFLKIINREGLALDRLGKDYLLHSSHGDLFKKAIVLMDSCINGISTAGSIYLINISRVGQFIGGSIGKTLSSYDYSHEKSENFVATAYALSYIFQEFRGISVVLLKKLFSDVIKSAYVGALEGALAPSAEQLKALEDISLKVSLNDIKEFANLAFQDFGNAYLAAQKKFSKYDKALEEEGMTQVFFLNPLKAEDERTLRGRQALLTREKYKPVASALTTVKSGIYAGKAVAAKNAYRASKKVVQTAVGAVLKAREKLQQSSHREK